MRAKRVKELERHDLSDGGVARVSRLGRTYSYSRTLPDECPKVVLNITKAEAYRLLEEALRRDVLDLD